jgi:tetratricopeptide (TPR) repeat protein
VADPLRIEELRRRVQQDPLSIAFAQLAEALRRAGRAQEAIDTCRAGLSYHPGYLSAHVTLGRALIDSGDLDGAQDELTRVLAEAPENLAAVKGLADIHQRRGELHDALDQYRRALDLAPHDVDLEQTVSRLATNLGPPPFPITSGGAGSLAQVDAVPTAGGNGSSAGQGVPARDEAVASLQVEALERWLDAILADRDRQS